MPPLVSVVIPIYDRTTMLEESIDSILRQNFKDFELILVTDGSPPETLEVIRRYASHPRIRCFYFLDNSGGPTRGRNKGIREARGKWIAFQDSDDIALPDRLGESLATARISGADIIYGDWIAQVDGANHAGVTDGQLVSCPRADLTLLRRCNALCLSTVMAKRSALVDVGGFKQNLGYLEDWEIWLRMAARGYNLAPVGKPLVRLRIHDGNAEKRHKPDFERWRSLVLADYRRIQEFPMKIVYITPGDGICGGVAVILQHVNRLLERGYDVSLLTMRGSNFAWFPDNKVACQPIDTVLEINLRNVDALVATGWETEMYLPKLEARRKYYFVQSDERRFRDDSDHKAKVNRTYMGNWSYFTEARWIQRWLRDEFHHNASYVPNGIDPEIFHRVPKDPWSPPRILIEGPVRIPWKGVADCYRAVKDLCCDIWLVSTWGEPEMDWKIDRFFNLVPQDHMRDIYSSCDVFLKMSRIEGFFGPPMEAMACGCPVVVGDCSGAEEYIRDGENALMVPQGDINAAKQAVRRILEDENLRQRLIAGGLETAKQWDWNRSIDALEQVLHQ